MKLLRIRWTDIALDDLRGIRDYVAFDSPARAQKLASRLRSSFERLRRFPRSGRLLRGFEARGFREVIVAPYRIVYRETAREIQVLRVWHGRRDLGDHDLD